MRQRLSSLLRRASEYLKNGGKGWPRYFVRVGTRYSDACQIAYAARYDEPPWTDALVQQVCEMLLEVQGTDISIYASNTRDRFEAMHALGVMAGSLSVDSFSPERRAELVRKLDSASRRRIENPKLKKQDVSDEFGRKVVSFVFSRELLDAAEVKWTPENNLNFAPADQLHHDARPADVTKFARALLDGIRRGDVTYTFHRSPEFRTQAAIALSWCVYRFGDLAGGPPPAWRNGETLTSVEQLARLRFVAGDQGIQSRIELSR
jgi:hypothetical protein